MQERRGKIKLFNLISKYMKSGGSMPLKRLCNGDVFMKHDCYYMKINNVMNAVNLKTGNLCYFGGDAVVMLMCYDVQKAE